MIQHDSRFEEIAEASFIETDVIVTRRILGETGYEDDTLSWTSSDALMSVKIDAVGEMLGTATKKAVVRLLGVVEGASAGDLFQIRLGVYDTVESAFNYISQGHFIVDNVNIDYEAGSTTVTLYDHMWTAGKTLYHEAVASEAITYPITIEAFAAYMAQLLDLELMADFDDLPNSQYEILEDLYTEITGATLQNAIQDIAGATGTTARITDTTLVFSSYEVIDETLDSNTLKTLKIADTYGPVTSVVLGRMPQNDNIALYASNPATTAITAVNTTTNLLTITAHSMADGNMVRLDSTLTLPAPLLRNTNYFVFTDGDADDFALAPTYADAIAGTNLIDLTTAGTGDISVVPLTAREIQINNNEILDDDRQTHLPGLYNKLAGIDWTDVKADTIGLGWHEVGDVIKFAQADRTVRAFLSEVHLDLSGSIKENLVSIVPKVAAIDYQSAGGIMRTLYNTEIKVDKQNQLITSIVERQDTIEGVTNESFTSITQDVDDVILTIQKSGGGNLLLNSVGFAKEQTPDADDVNYARLVSWDYPDSYSIAAHGTVTSYDSSESQNYGGISGRVIQMSTDYLAPETVSITQRVNVAVGTPLSFAMRVRNELAKGEATITLSNDNDNFTFTVDDSENRVWEEFMIEDFETTMSWLDVKIEATAESFRFTDLRLLYGSTLQGWVQSNGEILSANVQFNKDGMRIFDESHDTETRVTYNEFSTRRRTDGVVLFEADDTGVVTNDLKIKGSTSYVKNDVTIIKQITIAADNPKAGIAFVKGADV